MSTVKKTQETKEPKGFILPDHSSMVDNVIAVYSQANAAQLVAGATWYSDAHTLAAAIHDDVQAGAAIIAVLSPMLSWSKNAPIAVLAARAGTRRPAGVIGRNWTKAKRARRVGADLDAIVKGPKVRDFWACIASNGTDSYAVCVDRHAVAIACGRFLDSKESGDSLAGARYKKVANAYRDAAVILGLTPCILQAVTWVVWRDTPWRDRPTV